MTPAAVSQRDPVGTFWLLDLARQEPSPVAPRIEARFGRAGEEAAAELAGAMELAGPAPVVERFSGGRRCYVARVGGAVAAYGWVSFEEEWIGELGKRLRLAPGDAYVWDCVCLPAYRGKRLFPALLAYVARDLRTEGLRRVWIGANTESVASQKGIALAGFQPMADVFLAPGPGDGPASMAGRPGVPEPLVEEIRAALLPGDG